MTYDQILSTLMDKIPEPMFQQSYAAHMATIVEVLHVQLAAGELPANKLEAPSVALEAPKPVEWREPDDLPEEGDLIEIELASGELLRGEVSEIDEQNEMDVELTGAEAAPMSEREGSIAVAWWTSGDPDWDDENERRVRWRKLDQLPTLEASEAPSVKLEGEGFDADGRPPIGAKVMITLASGDLVEGEVTHVDRTASQGLDVEIKTSKNPDGNPGHWWTGTNPEIEDERDRRVAIRILEAPSKPARRASGCGG